MKPLHGAGPRSFRLSPVKLLDRLAGTWPQRSRPLRGTVRWLLWLSPALVLRRLASALPRRRLLFVLLAAGIPSAFAQQAQVRVGADPHYVGVPIDLQIIVEGFEPSPEPSIEVDTPPGATLRLVGISPNVSTSIQIINGRMTREERVRFVYQYRLLGSRPGPLEIGPFRVSQGSSRVTTRAVGLDIRDVPKASKQRFRLVLPEGPFWVGERVPIEVQWWLTESFAERLAGRRARVPLFDYVDRFRFEDQAAPKAKTTLVVDTVSGELQLPANAHT